jgi:putative tryptophan/tyrosine transport system substrate-binding protein
MLLSMFHANHVGTGPAIETHVKVCYVQPFGSGSCGAIIHAQRRIDGLGMRRRNLMTVLAGAAAYPLLAGAQKAMPMVALLLGGRPAPDDALVVAAFLQGLGETGDVEGRNVAIDYRWAEDRYDRLPALATDLVSRKIDVIAAGNFSAALAAKSATSTITIIFAVGVDPVERGLLTSFSRPGGNLTGSAASTLS